MSVHGFLEDTEEILAVGAFCDLGGKGAELVGFDVAESIDDLFGAGDLKALPLLNGVDEGCGLEE